MCSPVHGLTFLISDTFWKIPALPFLDLIRQHLSRNRFQRKRGWRGGTRNRLQKRGSMLPLPAFTLLNVRSQWNKMDELSALIESDSDFLTSMFCSTKTCFSEDITVSLPEFSFVHFDRDSRKMGKSIEGGLCMAVNDRWATNYTISETAHGIMILCLLFCPHYPPCEFTQLTVILAFVPDNALAAERTADSHSNAVARVADITTLLPQLEQYVTTPSKLDRMLDRAHMCPNSKKWIALLSTTAEWWYTGVFTKESE